MRRTSRGCEPRVVLARAVIRTACCLAVMWVGGACGDAREAGDALRPPVEDALRPPPEGWAADAKMVLAKQLVAQRAHRFHPADGGGRAWLRGSDEAEPRPVRAGSRAVFPLVYEAGEHGIAVGGRISLQVPKWWGWDPPQVAAPARGGYVRFSTAAEGVRLVPRAFPRLLRLDLLVEGRRLEPGEEVQLTYGAGTARARVDRFAERGERLWIAVDGDGDRVHRLLDDSPQVDIVADEPRKLSIVLPSTARPGQTARVHVAALDEVGNVGGPHSQARVRLLGRPEGWEIPEEIQLGPGDGGFRILEVTPAEVGVFRLGAVLVGGDGREMPATRVRSNPMEVSVERGRILWADLHGHSQLSDGTGTPGDYYRYARDVAGLDMAVLTDHDHWGLRPLDQRPDLWERIVASAAEFNQPGRFVTLVGYEWTSWLQGHRHVLYFDERGPILSSNDPRYETPAQLWEGLRGKRALTFAHHSAGGSISTNWRFPPDPVLEPLTEIVSSQGSSESAETPGRIRDAVPDNYVRDVLDRGVRFGFVGSGDGHGGHPGLTQAWYPSGGLAALHALGLDRDSALEAMRERRVYATNGPRIALFATLDGQPMGAELDVDQGTSQHVLELAVRAQAPIARIEMTRRGGRIETLEGAESHLEWEAVREVSPLDAGEYLYLRVVQQDGGAAWSSPWFAP